MTAPAQDQQLVETWRGLLDQHARITSALERVLQEQYGLGVSEFEVLERLVEARADDNRMQDLAGSVHLSQSALSRLIGRLEAEGLVSRTICPQDRRGIFACVTAEGKARYEAAKPAQRQVLADALR